MSSSGRATEFMRAWGNGQAVPHMPGCLRWGADPCDRCVYEAYPDPWDALVVAARIAWPDADQNSARLEAVRAAHSKLHGRCDNPICPLRAALSAAPQQQTACDHGLVGGACVSTFNGSAEHCPGRPAAPQPGPGRPDWLPADFPTPPAGMHWVHPADGKHSEPEPDRFDCGHWYLIADDPQPLPSDEPARCEHGLTEAHWIGKGKMMPFASCPGPAASGTPGGGS